MYKLTREEKGRIRNHFTAGEEHDFISSDDIGKVLNVNTKCVAFQLYRQEVMKMFHANDLQRNAEGYRSEGRNIGLRGISGIKVNPSQKADRKLSHEVFNEVQCHTMTCINL
jgi:hypothetical protein